VSTVYTDSMRLHFRKVSPFSDAKVIAPCVAYINELWEARIISQLPGCESLESLTYPGTVHLQ
jgi:hypothetical protein